MRFGGAVFTVLNHEPILDFPLPLLALSTKLNIHLGPSNSIRIAPYLNVPSFTGRITAVKPSIEHAQREQEELHPYIDPDDAQDTYLRVQYYLKRDASNEICDGWPFTPQETTLACSGLQELASSNCVIWISVRQVASLVFVPHADECANHTFGPMYGRANTYFIINKVMINADFNSADFISISSHDHAFIPSGSHPSTITEHYIEGLYNISKANTKNIQLMFAVRVGYLSDGSNPPSLQQCIR
jgi:hypothetical protein